MGVTLKILVPEDTRNYVRNPSIRYDTSGWIGVGSTISRVLDYALFGISSLKVVTDGLVLNEGAYYRVNGLSGISEAITASAYVRGAGKIRIRLIESGGDQWISEDIALHSDRWERIRVSGFSNGSNDIRLYVETADDVARAITFYVDGAQIERKPYTTSYCDGEQPGCRWLGIEAESDSSRDGYSRVGGKWITLVEPCRENDDIYVTVISGAGMAPIQNNIQSWALAPGSYYSNSKVLDRVIIFNFFVKKEHQRITNDIDLSKLHELRQQLIDIIKPDKTAGDETFLLSYQEEGKREMFIKVRYEAGLEGDWDIRNQWVNSFPIRVLAVEPFWTDMAKHSIALNYTSSILFNCIAARVNGEWNNMNYGTGYIGSASDQVTEAMALGRRGEIFAGLNIYANFNALAIDPFKSVSRVGYYDGTQWQKMDAGIDVPPAGLMTYFVRAMATAPNGDIYITGLFVSVSGTVCNNVARWNYATKTWSALGAGLNGEGQAIAIAPNGDVYVGGQFTTAGGITAKYIARWDGISWHSCGDKLGFNQYVTAIAITKDGSTVYVGGDFTDQFGLAGNALLYIASYDPSTNLFSAMGSGFDNFVKDLAISPSGILYAGGYFLNSGSTAINLIAKWNGSIWTPLADGLTNDAGSGRTWGIAVLEDERVLVVGVFNRSGTTDLPNVGLWNGSTWVHIDLKIAVGETDVEPLICLANGKDIYIGGKFFSDFTKTSVTSAITYVTNYGTAEVSPIIYIVGPGKLKWIENQTAKKTVYMDLDINDDEEIFIDFGTGNVWSTVRGNLDYAIMYGSQFSDFTLIPGENKLAVFMTDAVGASMYIYHNPRHWSADATVNAKALE